LELGYNWQFSRNWLFGIETDFDWSGLKGSGSSSGVFGGVIPFSATVDEHIRWFGTVRGRIGLIPINNLLAYFTGGFAYGRVEHSGNYVNNGVFVLNNEDGGFGFLCVPGATCFSGSSNGVMTGWTIGGGFEYAFWRNITVKAEYLYVNLETNSFTETATGPFPSLALSSFNANFSRTNFNIARVGLNYQFH
jgi:outer membrane immunogenic protein